MIWTIIGILYVAAVLSVLIWTAWPVRSDHDDTGIH